MNFDEPLLLDPLKSVHLIGVGGAGMSALAGILAERGFTVSGSDNRDSPVLERLRRLGVRVQVGQRPEGAAGADQVVISQAIRPENPELAAAIARGQPIYHRSQLLAALLADMRRVAITGTHGKSTATAMLGWVLTQCGQDPTVIVGGDAPGLPGGNYRLGKDPLAVFEACESDGSFLRYRPHAALITNVEEEHVREHGSFAALVQCFRDFIALIPEDGFLVYGADCRVLAELAQAGRGKRISYGLGSGVQFSATAICHRQFSVSFQVMVEGEPGPEVHLAVPGAHNVSNALGVLAAARELGVALDEAARALESYRAVARRFELIGQFRGALVIDDYAHHPTEVAATLAAARRGFPERRLIAVFQPHLFSRTQRFASDFARELTTADVVVVNSIYAAREDPVPGVTGALIADQARLLAPDRPVLYRESQEDILSYLREVAQPDDLILTLGAGDIRRVAERLVQEEQGS